MKSIITLVWIGFAAALCAAPKFAVVRVTDIYRALPSTLTMQREILGQREAVMKNDRAERLRAVIADLQSMQAQLEGMKDDLEAEGGKKLVRSYEIKRQEAETLRQEFEGYREAEDKRINKEMVTAMRDSLNRITEASRKIATERNMEGVFDTSGNSNTGVPFVLYSESSVDITDDVIGLLGEKPLDVPTEGAEAETGTAVEKPE
jgi:Skp family chaperone for outer membrane proteins